MSIVTENKNNFLKRNTYVYINIIHTHTHTHTVKVSLQMETGFLMFHEWVLKAVLTKEFQHQFRALADSMVSMCILSILLP